MKEEQHYHECISSELERKPGLLGWIDANFEKPLLIVGMLSIILFITYQTALRNVVAYINDASKAGWLKDTLTYLTDSVLGLSHSATWAEESSRYIFIAISYLAIPVAIKCRTNIRVDLFYDKFSPRWQKICWIIMSLGFLGFTGVLFTLGTQEIMYLIQRPQTTAALRIPFYVPYAVIPVAFGLMSFRLIQDLFLEMRLAGLKDSLLAMAITGALLAPVLLYDEFNAIMLLFGYFILMLYIGMPVSIALGLASLLTILGAGTLSISYLASTAFSAIDSFPIMAIPFFIAAGVFMGAGGLSQRLRPLRMKCWAPCRGAWPLPPLAHACFLPPSAVLALPQWLPLAP